MNRQIRLLLSLFYTPTIVQVTASAGGHPLQSMSAMSNKAKIQPCAELKRAEENVLKNEKQYKTKKAPSLEGPNH